MDFNDNGGTLATSLQKEFFEVVYSTKLDVTGYEIVPYRGDWGSLYVDKWRFRISDSDTTSVHGGYTFAVFNKVRLRDAEAKSGSKDGFMLLDREGDIVEFWSYGAGGTFSVMDTTDPRFNAVSTHIVDASGAIILETKTTPETYSIQRSGTGCAPSDFTWLQSAQSTKGIPNTGQVFNCP
jgi:hypothetical protein